MTLKIIAKPTIDPNVYEFSFDKITGIELPRNFTENTAKHPLLTALFELDIMEVMIDKMGITIRKKNHAVWPVLARKVGPCIRAHWPITQLSQLLSEQENNNSNPIASIESIQETLDKYINPQISAHGGHARAIKLANNALYLEMSGGCQGCSQSSATVQTGIKKVLAQHHPEITKLIDETDHQSGSNPFYQ